MRTACLGGALRRRDISSEPHGRLRRVGPGKSAGMRAVFVFYSLVIVMGLIAALFVALAQA
jgi:hypothetical protein